MIRINSLSGGRTSSYMAVHHPADINLFALITIEDRRATPKDKKLVQKVSDKIGKEFIATAEDDRTLTLMFDLEQIIGNEIIWLNERSYDSLFYAPHIFGGIPNRLPSWARRFCTTELKLIPIFNYCFLKLFKTLTDQIEMQIGYRADEEHRKTNLLAKDGNSIRVPFSCNLYGQNRQKLKTFHWRKVTFPLIDQPVSQFEIIKFWSNKNLVFPPQSNCAGCFHKDEVSIHLQWKDAPKQMQWFADQEKLNKGTWFDNGLKYEQIRDMNFTIPIDYSNAGVSCSGGCPD